VIDALAEQRSHVPYRDSRLTRVLEEALGGNCRTALLVTASACAQHYDETLSSLRFASRTTKVRNHAKVNYMYSADQLLSLVAQLQRELSSAKRQIAQLGAKRPEQQIGSENNRRNKQGCKRQLPKSRLSMLGIAPDSSSGGGASGSQRLASSGSAPSLSLNFGRFADEDEPRRHASVSAMGGSSLNDIDEMSCWNQPSTFIPSCGSGSRSTSSRGSSAHDDEVEEDEEADLSSASPRSVHGRARDAAWRRQVQDAIASMESALLAQESALEEAQLLPSRHEPRLMALRPLGVSTAGGADAACGPGRTYPSGDGGPSSSSNQASPNTDVVAERFRALRHSVDARSLLWRLHLERHRTESLSLELEMRRCYYEDLEQQMEERTAQLMQLMSDGSGETRLSSGSLGEAMRHVPALQRRGSTGLRGRSASSTALNGLAGTTGTSQGSSSSGVSRRTSRITRPVPRGPRCGWAAATASSAARSSSVAAQRASTRAASPLPGNSSEGASATASAAGDESPLRVAGTGDTGELGGSGGICAAGGSVENRIDSDSQATVIRTQLEAHIERLQGELQRRGTQVSELAAELGARDVRICALRHEVLVKDSLLKKLGQETIRRAQGSDEGMEQLLDQAMSSLVACLTREQVTIAAASGERAIPPLDHARLSPPVMRR